MTNFSVRNIPYNCAEQFMMAEKARLFGDKEIEEKIMNSSDPKEQQDLGRQVKNFNQEKWNKHARDIVYEGNYYRFNHNEYLKNLLFETVGTTLVETSPYDKIWGIGLRKNDPRVQDRTTWRGKNWLGEVLTKVRDDLIEELT